MTARTLTPRERAAAKAALTRSIKLRQHELARLSLYTRDAYLQGVLDRLEREIAELSAKRAQLDPRKVGQLPELASRYLEPQRDPRRSQAQEQAAERAITRREAQDQVRDHLERIPPCVHGDVARLCPRCNQTPLEEVPF